MRMCSKIYRLLQVLVLFSLLSNLSSYSAFAEGQNILYQGNSYTTYQVDTSKSELRLFWKKSDGQRFANALALEAWAKGHNRKLVFATNGGIFEKNKHPSGLYVEGGLTKSPLNTGTGWGNFYLKPNGVFVLRDEGTQIIETESYQDDPSIKYAVQSGPLLVLKGKIHPLFRKGSKNIYIRSGVGVREDSTVLFAITNNEVNFFDFASFFLHRLNCEDALYLDGLISRMYLPQLERMERDGSFSSLFAVFEDAN